MNTFQPFYSTIIHIWDMTGTVVMGSKRNGGANRRHSLVPQLAEVTHHLFLELLKSILSS